jgi:hypothetical protein
MYKDKKKSKEINLASSQHSAQPETKKYTKKQTKSTMCGP